MLLDKNQVNPTSVLIEKKKTIFDKLLLDEETYDKIIIDF